MAPVFPLSKLAFLFVKQVAKPISTRIKRRAIKSVVFRERFCLPPARCTYHTKITYNLIYLFNFEFYCIN